MDPYAPRNPDDPRHTREADRLTDLILEVYRLYGYLEENGSRLSKLHAQSTARWRVMGAAARKPGTVSQIARRIGLTRQGVQRTANALAADGLLEFEDNPTHRRSPIARLSNQGEDVLHSLSTAQIEWSNAVATGMSVDQLSDAVSVLRTLADRLERWGDEPSLRAVANA